MANLSKVIYINEVDYSTLLNGGTITKGGVTYSHDPTALYVIKNVSAPEYAETAGYATTAGQATKATQDEGGNVISETYAKKVVIGTLTYNNDVWSCNKTYSQLALAMLAGDIVLLKQGNTVYYPIEYPYLNGNDEVSGILRFRYIGSGGYSETFLIDTDSTIEYIESDLESDIYEQGINHQRTVLRLTIGQNNTLTFTDQNNNTVSTSQAYYLLVGDGNDLDTVIQYNDKDYHKQAQESDNSCITFVSVNPEEYLIYYLSFDCSTRNTVSLVTSNYINFSEATFIIEIDKVTPDLPYTCNKTNMEIYNAWQAGKNPIVVEKYLNRTYHLTSLPTQTTANFGGYDYLNERNGFTKLTITTANNQQTVTLTPDTGAYYSITSSMITSWNNAGKPFIANLTGHFDENDELDYYTCDKTFEQLTEAITKGRQVYLSEDDVFYTSLVPYGTLGNDGTLTFSSVLLGNGKILKVNINSSNTITYSVLSVVPDTRTINNKPLSSNITLTASDVGADVFVVNIESDVNDEYTCDKTNAEIYAAWQADRNVIAIEDSEYVYSLTCMPGSDTAFFNGIKYDESECIYSLSIHTSNNIQTVNKYFVYLQHELVSGTNIKTINNQSLLGSGNLTASDIGALPSNTHIPNDIKVGSVAGKLYRDNVGGSGNFSISGNSGCIPNLTAGTFLVSIYAKSTTQSYTFRFNFGSSVTYDLSTTNGEISDVRQITIPSSGTFSGLVLNSSVASGTILYVVMYNYLTPVSTVGVAAVTNRYADLDGTPTLPSASNTTPLLVRGSSGSAGSSGAYARADHKHAICKSFGSYSSLVADTDAQLGEIRYDSDGELFYIYDANNSTWVRLDNKDTLLLIIDITSNNDTYTCNKTNAEIYKAWQAGRDVYVRRGGEYLYPLASEPGSTFAYFMGPRYDELGVFDRIYISTVNSTQQVTTTNMIMPLPGSSNPQMDGTASPGAANTTTYSKSDHVHPSDTSRVPTSRTINGHALSSDLYLTVFGNLGSNGFERDNYNSTGGWAGVEIVTPDPLVTYIDILSNKLYRYDPPTSRYIELSGGDLSTITSTAITDLTDIL